jgi:trehalose 6-phosphate synthase/phosphatase
LHDALEVSPEESKRRNIAMQTRLKFRTAGEWCAEFLSSLEQVTKPAVADKRLRMIRRQEIRHQWDKAQRRLVLCDYDGTLTPLVRTPERAKPTPSLRTLLRRLGSEPNVDVVLVSGRDKKTMEEWFGDLPVGLIAEHGAWKSNYCGDDPAQGDSDTLGLYEAAQKAASPRPAVPVRSWVRAQDMPEAARWQPVVERILQDSVAHVPKSFVEHKSDALAWHYRLADSKAARAERQDLFARLAPVVEEWHLTIMKNSKVVEVCPAVISKGEAVAPLAHSGKYDVVVAVGDDTTDETMFAELPDTTWTFKIGAGATQAKYRLLNSASTRRMLGEMIAESDAVEYDAKYDADFGSKDENPAE